MSGEMGGEWKSWKVIDPVSYQNFVVKAKEIVRRGGRHNDEMREIGLQWDFTSRLSEKLFYGTESVMRRGNWRRDGEAWAERLRAAMAERGMSLVRDFERKTEKYYEYRSEFSAARGLTVGMKIYNDHLYINTSVIVHEEHIEKAVEKIAELSRSVEAMRTEVEEALTEAARGAMMTNMRMSAITSMVRDAVRQFEGVAYEIKEQKYKVRVDFAKGTGEVLRGRERMARSWVSLSNSVEIGRWPEAIAGALREIGCEPKGEEE